ncbi:MAG TPA: cytochrome C oxidase subunit II, partial [Thioalkalivibrio sp.]|nr:cytochrome C oxidase subunit II [Thioalkalivibrio sp.]
MEQALAWYLSLLFMALVAGVFVWVRLNSTRSAQFEPIRDRAYRFRPRLFWALVILGVPVMGATLMMVPYGAAEGLPSDALHVEVEGRQFAWTMSESSARAGQTVVFHVTSADVNHGFGIYDAQMRLRAQTQAMPGYT